MKKSIAILLTLMMLFATGCDDETASDFAAENAFAHSQAANGSNHGEGLDRRDYRVATRGNGEDVVTLMLYMCGSDLETDGGCASADLNEIVYADISDNVNIIIETGGALEWQNSMIPNDTNVRWQATNEGLNELEDVGLHDMTDPDSLSDFIQFCADEYPADRYMLVLWDHGGGTTGGYAVDENFPQSDCMSITEINSALAEAGVVFDFIGFDACLMATAETAFMLDQYADFMVASQRVEPGDGWYYTPWVTALSENTSIETSELGQIIADSFIEHNENGYYGHELTLSVLDLTYINGLYEKLYHYFDETENALVNDQAFMQISQARYDSRAMADNCDLVDIQYLVQNLEIAESQDVLDMLNRCVTYNAATIDNYNGLCLYFPYSDLHMVGEALPIFDAIGIGDSYQSFITSFASVMAGGQIYAGGGSHPYAGSEGYSGEYTGWMQQDLVDDFEGYYDENSYSDEFPVVEKGDYFVLQLPEDVWELMTAYELSVFMEIGEGEWLDLGSDNVYEFDDDGDLIVDFDYTWVSLNGEIVCFYAEEEQENGDYWMSYGYTPCLINGRDAELIIVWDSDNPDGFVPGYRYQYEGSVTQKGIIPLSIGDRIELLCDYYTDEGGYEESFVYDEFTVNGDISVSYEDIGEANCEIYYVLYDIYGNSYWTESIYFE